MNQLDLNFEESRFEVFLRENPEVYRRYCDLAVAKIKEGATRIGSKAIFEVLRWNFPKRANGEPYAYNNNWTPFLARKFENDFPNFKGIFETRKAKADEE